MTYQQIVQKIILELGLSGTPTVGTITGNSITGIGSSILELQNVCNWIHDATLDIDNQWLDWKYHWVKYGPQTAAAAAQTIPAPTGGQFVQQWDLNKFRFRTTSVGGATWAPVEYYERQQFLDLFDPDNAVAGPPVAFTIEPDNTLFFSAPFDQQYDFVGEFWRRPFELVNGADTPLMPSQYHRMILCRAAVMYANREDAPELIAGLEAEYIQFLDKLEGDQLEGFALRRNSVDRDRRRHHDHVHQFLQ